MSENETLAKALADVRQRRIEVQAEHERLAGELAKLRLAEKSLAAIVEGGSLESEFEQVGEDSEDGSSPRQKTGRRGSRGPRANSAKGRLRTLLMNTGAQGLAQAEIARRLPDVAPATLNAYLSTMSTSGEIIRNGDFFRIEPGDEDPGEDNEGQASESEDEK
jgi:hypothetical protein